MEVVGDMVTVQQNERSNEEEEREREREEATPSADIERATEIAKKKKPRGETEGIVLNTSEGDVFI